MNPNAFTEDRDTRRSNEWVALSAVQAGLVEFIEDIAHDGRLDVRIPPGTLQIERDDHEWAMALYGTGGGFCWAEDGCSKRRVVKYARHYQDGNDLEVRRV